MHQAHQHRTQLNIPFIIKSYSESTPFLVIEFFKFDNISCMCDVKAKKTMKIKIFFLLHDITCPILWQFCVQFKVHLCNDTAHQINKNNAVAEMFKFCGTFQGTYIMPSCSIAFIFGPQDYNADQLCCIRPM